MQIQDRDARRHEPPITIAETRVNVLVLGAYGVIGEGIVRALRARGFTVVGLGRSVAAAERRVPEVAWRQADIARLLTAED